MKTVDRFSVVRVVDKNGVCIDSQECDDRWDAEQLAKELVVKVPDSVAYVLDVVAAYHSEPRVEQACLKYRERTPCGLVLPVEEAAVEWPADAPQLSGVSVQEDF